MSLLTLEQYKALKGVSGTDQDTQITILIEAVELEIRGYCRIPDGEDLPGALRLTAADMVEHQLQLTSGIVSQSLEGASVTFADKYSSTIEKMLKRYRRASYV